MLYVSLALLCLAGILLALVPAQSGAQLFSIFSFEDFGIRTIRRWNNTTDSFGNFFLFISVVFCLVYVLFPYYEMIYAAWLGFTLICTLARAYMSMRSKHAAYSFFVILSLYAVAAAGLWCVLGGLNNRIFVYPIYELRQDLMGNTLFDAWYFLQHVTVPYAAVQGLVMLMPLFYLWNQFKYFRLEDTFRGYHITTFVLHAVLLCAVIAALSKYGFIFINEVYQIQYPAQ